MINVDFLHHYQSFSHQTILPTVQEWQDSATLINNVKNIANQTLKPKVIDIDKGYYPIAEMAQLAKVGAFSAF